MLTRDQITAIYEEACENQPPAGQDVTEADKDIRRALDAYCDALQYETFLWAYELGYQAGQAAPERQENIQTIDFINRMLRGFDARRLNLVYHLCLGMTDTPTKSEGKEVSA